MYLLVNLITIALIFLISWFFFVKKDDQPTKARQTIKIKVDGGYQPSVIQIPVGQPIRLEFERVDPTSCLEEVVIPDFKIRQYLPLNQVTPVTITPQQPGEYQFHCGMSMFFGKIIVTR